jgi:hypothetical protein
VAKAALGLGPGYVRKAVARERNAQAASSSAPPAKAR